MKTTEMEYDSFLMRFENAGYKFVGYDNFKHGEDWQIILRHDIDFDTGLAAQMAEIETSYKIRATYFYWLSNNFYNVLYKKTYKDIKKLHGSRDYYQFKQGGMDIELIPVLKFLKAEDVENIIDFSLSHVK